MPGTRKARIAVLVAAALVGPAAAASAATFEVTTTKDRAGACDDSCALREAVLAAGATIDDDVIRLPAGAFELARQGAGEDEGVTGDLDLREETPSSDPSGDLLIRGRGPGKTTIDAAGLDRVFHLPDDAAGNGPSVELRRLTVKGGRSADDGGGVRVDSDRLLTLRQVVVAGNRGTATDTDGGGVENRGSLTLDRATLRDNRTGNDGGGISMNGGVSLTVERSTISGNVAGGPDGGGDGGGIYAPADGTTSGIVNSTVSGNVARGTSSQGGGIYVSGQLDLTFSTLAFNHATGDAGGGINTVSAAADLTASIVARNRGQAGSENCGGSGVIAAAAANLEDLDTCGLGGSGDLANASPGLKPLRDNGGPTRTHAIGAGSDAVDAAAGVPCPFTDQRGRPRPAGAECDTGSFERGA